MDMIKNGRNLLLSIYYSLLLHVLYKIMGMNSSIRILYECCTVLLQMELLNSTANTKFGTTLQQNNNKTILITGMRKNVNIHNVISTFQMFGTMNYIALASFSRDFGFVRYHDADISNAVVRKFRSSEIVVQDVA